MGRDPQYLAFMRDRLAAAARHGPPDSPGSSPGPSAETAGRRRSGRGGAPRARRRSGALRACRTAPSRTLR
ncbi:hypothetical protein, partial [Actinomadura sp. CNU-125]|uniref:hypothetical protein n=1 Tax=Actinomadura sp. CNU-125 TaxID=1904961 RepID=UPI0021CC8C19